MYDSFLLLVKTETMTALQEAFDMEADSFTMLGSVGDTVRNLRSLDTKEETNHSRIVLAQDICSLRKCGRMTVCFVLIPFINFGVGFLKIYLISAVKLQKYVF